MNANAPPAVPLDTELQQAIAEHQAGRYLEAEEIYLSILQAHPYHAIANHNLGLLAGQVGQHEAGLPYLRKAMSIDPDEGQFWLSYANGLLQAGQPDEALDIIDTAIARGLDNEHRKSTPADSKGDCSGGPVAIAAGNRSDRGTVSAR